MDVKETACKMRGGPKEGNAVSGLNNVWDMYVLTLGKLFTILLPALSILIVRRDKMSGIPSCHQYQVHGK